MTDTGKLGMTIVRLAIAVIAIVHGLANTFGVFDGPGLDRFATELEGRLGVGATVIAYTVAIGQLLGGVAMLLGTAARAVAVVFSVFLVADILVLGKLSAFFVRNNGCEFDLAVLALCVVVIAQGPGAYAVHLEKPKKP